VFSGNAHFRHWGKYVLFGVELNPVCNIKVVFLSFGLILLRILKNQRELSSKRIFYFRINLYSTVLKGIA